MRPKERNTASFGRTTKVVAVSLSLIVAGFSGSQALGMVVGWISPEQVLDLLPPNGEAMSLAAQARIAPAAQPGHNAPPAPEALALARRAFMHEPLSHEAVSAAGLYYGLTGGLPKARRLMHQSLALSRRDSAATLWLVQDYAKLRDIPGVLRHVDLGLRTSSSTGALLNPVLARAIAADDAIDPFFQLLSKRPPWAEDFWQAVLRQDAATVNAGRLRTRLAQAGDRTITQFDEALAAKLVRAGAFAEAFALRDSLLGQGRGNRQTVTNGDFATKPRLPPLDWDLVSSGEIGADVLASSRQLQISSVAGVNRVAARQLLRLPAGQHRVSVKLDPPAASTRVSLRIGCANGDGMGTRVLDVPLRQPVSQTFSISPGCAYQWLEIALAIPEGAAADDVMIDGVAID